MSTKNKKKTYKQYDTIIIQRAIDDITQNKVSVRAASKKYKIPFSTLLCKYQGKYPIIAKSGPSSVLSAEEDLLVQWILHLNSTGFVINMQTLLNNVQKLVRSLKKETPFTNDRPSRKWYAAFLRRHPEISSITTDNISSRTEVSESVTRTGFENIHTYLSSKNLLNISAKRIFICNESSFLLNPKPKKVDETKSRKTIDIDEDEKECLTVLVTGNAIGQCPPPMVLYPYEKIPKNIKVNAPPEFTLGHSKNGCITAESFFEYISRTFYEWCVKYEIEFPVILFVDGRSSHLSMPLSDFCNKHQIELINATRLIQPMNTALFKPLKTLWNEVAVDWRIQNSKDSVDKIHFASLLKKALNLLDLEQILTNGFKACGLYPFIPEAINYLQLGQDTEDENNLLEISQTMQDISLHINFIENNIDAETITSFKQAQSSRKWTGEPSYEKLFEFWLHINDKQNQTDPLEIESNAEH